MLTPLGDPPLFLGYLEGVPFTWTFRLLPHWAVMLAVLLPVYFGYDSVQYAREPLRAIRRDRAGSWRTSMSAADREAVEAIAGELMREYGYA